MNWNFQKRIVELEAKLRDQETLIAQLEAKLHEYVVG